MMTNAAATTRSRAACETANTTQTVMIVNGSAEILEVLETALDAGHYDVVFVESTAHAYSHVKRARPQLVILCVRIDDADGFNVLSMLKLDPDTREIPVLTYTTGYEASDTDEEIAEPEGELFASKAAAVLMN